MGLTSHFEKQFAHFPNYLFTGLHFSLSCVHLLVTSVSIGQTAPLHHKELHLRNFKLIILNPGDISRTWILRETDLLLRNAWNHFKSVCNVGVGFFLLRKLESIRKFVDMPAHIQTCKYSIMFLLPEIKLQSCTKQYLKGILKQRCLEALKV